LLLTGACLGNPAIWMLPVVFSLVVSMRGALVVLLPPTAVLARPDQGPGQRLRRLSAPDLCTGPRAG